MGQVKYIIYFLGWVHGKRASKIFGLDLLEEYAFPQPMPEGSFYDYHIDNDLATLILATEESGMFVYPIKR